MDYNIIIANLDKNDIPKQSVYEKLIENIDFRIDKDYLDLISKYDGLDGEIGKGQYLSLWKIESVLSCNPYYEDSEACNDLFFF